LNFHLGPEAEILPKMFNLAIRWRICADNPAAGEAEAGSKHKLTA
jgi:hypothetical protein